MIKKKIKMDLSISNAPQVVYAVQGDTNTRNVVIDLYNAGAAWTVPDGASGVVKFQKADGKGGIYDKLPNGFPAVVYEENSNQIEVSLAPQVLTFPGEVKAQVSLIYDNNIISTFSFVVLVQADPSANVEKSADYVNWDRYFIPQTSGASVGQYLKITKVDDLGRVVEVSPVDAPSGSGTIDGDLDMESKSILNLRSLEFWNEDELATVVMQAGFPDGDNESEDFNGVVEFRTSRGDEPVVIRNVADAKNPNEAVSKKQLDESMDHSKLSNRDAADQHPISAISGLEEILDEVKNGAGGNANCLLTVETITIGEPGEPGNIPVAGITLDYSTISLDVGDSMMLAASVTPSNATNNAVLWESSDTSIAKVENGYVTALASGNCTITAKSAENNSIKATCSVAVVAESGGDEPGNDGSETVKVQLASHEYAEGILKKDGKTVFDADGVHFEIPYFEGMYISTGMNSVWLGNYPPFMVDDNGVVTVPEYSEGDRTCANNYGTNYITTLTGFSENAKVYVNVLVGNTDGLTVQELLNSVDVYYYTYEK